MPQLFHVTFPGGCNTLPEGFWSAVDVWIQKPHVVNKRLCGVKGTDGKDVDREELRFLLRDPVLQSELPGEVLTFITCGGSPAQIHEEHKPFSSTVRRIIPKINSYGKTLHKDVVLKDFDRQQVTFVPYEEDAEGRVSLKKGNIYQIQLCSQDCNDWSLKLCVLDPDAWLSDGVIYPKLPWLGSELLPKLVRWATESKTSEFRSTLSLLPVEKYSLMYQQLKDKYKAMVKVWPEVTDPEKFVYEDVAIATYLLVLWCEERAEKGLTCRQSFVDLGCGNGLLVHILTNEGHPGKGIDVRRRKIWDMYGPQTLLEEKAITPSESFLFPDTDWLIGNHSDELTPWIPVIAARSSYSCRYFVLPCCFFDFYGRYQRRQCNRSQYKEYIDFVTEVSRVCGFTTEEDCLRIPSTKRVCLVGKSRNYQPSAEAEAELRRAHYIQSRQTTCGVAVQESDMTNHVTGSWGVGFQPRDKVEAVRNCATLPRDFVDGVVLRVANVLLEMTADDGRRSSSDWNQGGGKESNLNPAKTKRLVSASDDTFLELLSGPVTHHLGIGRDAERGLIKTLRLTLGSLSVGEVAALLQQETLRLLKKECGGLQTLLKNNHQVFRVEAGAVHIRDWRDRKSSAVDAKRKPVAPGALKTRRCWFHAHHPQGCPLRAEQCAFAHGPEELRPSTGPLRKRKCDAFSFSS